MSTEKLAYDNPAGMWIDETLIICDFSSDDVQNFTSDDDTDEFLKI
jgi:hypothetical protein